ncbi:hypothetical protein ACEPAF_2175 [Sanghuangporus sanghuang]|uniref:Uncharacterized protein n=1 Tax=Sanghuangporus baumii TaxID=108892 RepID=A0A9Q5NAR7_SANBA|nr:hypothetical protein A7U60_g2612 [Sanghuangporus baumii]
MAKSDKKNSQAKMGSTPNHSSTGNSSTSRTAGESAASTSNTTNSNRSSAAPSNAEERRLRQQLNMPPSYADANVGPSAAERRAAAGFPLTGHLSEQEARRMAGMPEGFYPSVEEVRRTAGWSSETTDKASKK